MPVLRSTAHISSIILSLAFSVLPADAQIASTLVLPAGSKEWFNSAEWSAGVPFNPGDAAQLNLIAGSSSQVVVSGTVNLERLQFTGFGVTSIRGAGPLSFQSDGAGDLSIEASASGGTMQAAITTPVSWSALQPLGITVGPQATFSFSGAIATTAGDLVKQGVGELGMGGASPTWTGALTVEGGNLLVTNTQAFGAAAGVTTVRNGARLNLQVSAAEPFVLDSGVLQVKNVETTGDIVLTGTAQIFRGQNPLVTDPRGGSFESTLGTTFITSNITGAGDLEIRNESRDALTLRGNNSYIGRTIITAGAVNAATAGALGSADGGVTVKGGVLTVQAANNEKFRVEGGVLRFAAGSVVPVDSISLAGGEVAFPSSAVVATPIIVEGAGGAISGAASSWTGGSSGIGNLRVGGGIRIDAALAHHGDLTLQRATLNVGNSYDGKTIVNDTADINHAGAFGESQEVRVTAGELRLNTLPRSTPNFVLEGGSLVVANGLGPIASAITLGESSIRGNAVYNGPISVQAGPGRKILVQGTFNGAITGDGALELGGADVRLNAANDLRGPISIRGGMVDANHPQSLRLTNTNVSGGRLNLNVPANGNAISNEDFSTVGTIAFNVDQQIADVWVHHVGTLETGAQVGMQRLILLGGTNAAAALATTGTGRFRIDGELTNVDFGRIDAKLAGAGVIRSVGDQLTLAGDLHDFTGKIFADAGYTNVTEPAINGAGTAAIHVRGSGSLRFLTSNDTDYEVDVPIFLENAHGDGFLTNAALTHDYYASEAHFRGRLDVGDQGSTISGNMSIEGRLTGKNLTHRGGGLQLDAPQHELHGLLRLNRSSLGIEGAGQLDGIDAVQLENGSEINLGQSTLPAPNDRLGDSVEIRSFGGRINLYSAFQRPGVETLGTLRLLRGRTWLMANSDHGTPSASLTITSVERTAGSILHFHQGWWTSSIKIENPEPLVHGMLGAWAITDIGFATLDPAGNALTLAATATALNGASADDHVNVLSGQTLDADATIASFRSERTDTSIDLGNHRLTIASGGLFRAPNISNGQVTAGDAGPAELIMHEGGGLITADIVDNAAAGAVALVVNNGNVRLAGANTYTGGTWITGETDLGYGENGGTLRIQSYAAVPTGDRVFVDNGIYDLQDLPTGVVNLAELHVRENGRVSSGLAAINAGKIFLEEGTLYSVLLGNGPMFKTTDGDVQIMGINSPDYAGDVTVRGGRLLLGGAVLPRAKFQLEGGQVHFSDGDSIANSFVLKGGAIIGGRYTGDIDVQADSALLHEGRTNIVGTLRGAGDLTIRGRQDDRFGAYVGLFGNTSQFTGDFHIESGALRIGSPSAGGVGQITVEAAGRLILGSNSYTDPATTIANPVLLRGGTLYSTPPLDTFSTNQASPSVVTGTVTVDGEAYIGALRTGFKSGQRLPGLKLAGQVALQDGAQIFGLSDGRHTMASGDVALVDVAGQLNVGAGVTWRLLTSTLSITGAIRPTAVQSSIDFIGRRDLLRLQGADIQSEAGKSLRVMINGGELPLDLTGAGSILKGVGTLVGDFSLSAGAAVAPGASPGVLTIEGDLRLGLGAALNAELAGPLAGSQYDQLHVVGDVQLDGAMLNFELLNDFRPSPNQGFVVLRTLGALHGVFANAVNSITIGDVTLPVWYRSQMVIVGNVAAVPEPSTFIIAAASLSMCIARRSQTQKRQIARTLLAHPHREC